MTVQKLCMALGKDDRVSESTVKYEFNPSMDSTQHLRGA
jgi:hypothetical protein